MAKERVDVSTIVALIDEIDKAAIEKVQNNPQKINDVLKELNNAERFVKQIAGRFNSTRNNLLNRLQTTRRKIEQRGKGINSLHDTYDLIKMTNKCIPLLLTYVRICGNYRNELNQIKNIDPDFVSKHNRLEGGVNDFLKAWRNIIPALQTPDQFEKVLKTMYSAHSLSDLQRSIDAINSVIDNIRRPGAQLFTQQSHIDAVNELENARNNLLKQGIKKILDDTKDEIADYERDYLRLNPK